MTITEPATLITDYLLAAFTGTLGLRLFAHARARRVPAQWWWGAAFAATAFSAACGGTVHGMRALLPPQVIAGLWIATLEGLVVAAFAVVRGTLLSSPLHPGSVRSATLTAGAAYAVYGVWMIGNPRFVYAIAAYAIAMGVLVAFKLSTWDREPQAARWMVSGVAVSAIAAAVQQGRFSLHEHFNHNDLYHVIQALGVWLLYRGAHLGGSGSGEPLASAAAPPTAPSTPNDRPPPPA